jgi:bacterioferritin
MLNDALATELLCVLRYKRHYYTVGGPNSAQMRAEFLEHAQQEQEHADRIAERIVQLNGSPNFNPATLVARSHAEYDDSEDAQAMVRADLIAERVAIESYRQMIQAIGDKDPTTARMLTEIMAVEEEHADDMRDLLAM